MVEITRVHPHVYVCGIQALSENPIPDDVDRVITVCQDEVTDHISNQVAYEWYQMSDGPKNSYGGNSSYKLFEQAASSMFRALENKETVLIHCHMGQSRSVAVASAALGVFTFEGAREWVGIIKEKRNNESYPDGNLVDHAFEFTGEQRDIANHTRYTE